jgi:hypothetical protein
MQHMPQNESKSFEIGKCTPTLVDTYVEMG